MAPVLLEDVENGLLTLTLNRPERRNAMNPELCDALVAAISKATADPEVRAVLIKGAGGTFCVGGDVKSMSEGKTREQPYEERVLHLRRRMDVSRLIHEMPKPVVAMIEGAAAGAGLSIALSCDLRIAGSNAKITTAFAKVGLSGDYGGTWFLTQLVGSAKARELYLTSPVLTGEQAVAIGMVTEAVAPEKLEARAREVAMSLAQGPTVTLGYIKKNLNTAEWAPLTAALDGEAAHHILCERTEDHKEAANAFVEKRQATFKGR